MSIRCPDCGRDNADTAKFCAGCGKNVFQTLALSQPQPGPHLFIDPQGSQQIIPSSADLLASPSQNPLAAPDPGGSAAHSFGTHRQANSVKPLVSGFIDSVSETSVPPPRDYVWIALQMAILFAILPVLLSFFAGIGIAIIVIVVFGGWLILTVFGALAATFGKLIALLLPRRRPRDRDTTQVYFIVQEDNGNQCGISIFGDHVGGRLRKGDIVEVYGRHTRDGEIRARQVSVVGALLAAGTVQRRLVRGKMPMPAPIALIAWIGAIGVWGYFYLPYIIAFLQR